jgi:hypothetical protein
MLGMMQDLCLNQGDAWTLMQAEVEHYYNNFKNSLNSILQDNILIKYLKHNRKNIRKRDSFNLPWSAINSIDFLKRDTLIQMSFSIGPSFHLELDYGPIANILSDNKRHSLYEIVNSSKLAETRSSPNPQLDEPIISLQIEKPTILQQTVEQIALPQKEEQIIIERPTLIEDQIKSN